MKSAAILTAPDVVLLGSAAANAQDDAKVAKLATIVDNYQKAFEEPDYDRAKMYRDRFVFGIMAEIDLRYADSEHNLRAGRATFATAADIVQLGTTAAAGVVGAAGIKDMLAAAATASNGARLSAEKNFFNDQSTTALLTQMRASRGELEAQIIGRCSTPVLKYSLEEAWKDLVKYTSAGTLESALIALNAHAGRNQADAELRVQEVVEKLTPATSLDVRNARGLALIRQNIENAISPPNQTPDPVKREAATRALRDILQRAGQSPSPDATPEEMLQQLSDLLDKAQEDRTLLNRLQDAMQHAPASFGGTQ